ncbi:cation diffusion facilitator family transporter [Enterococcus canis]|uniref:Cation diffusion facilitator family transporter n=1 Tax=Enterococcus canis TaxID=214095 RepID=A0A1L8REJ2_9ENTE|nr:cation diffusion facilitator family transporter [Enterococcus canis]OJG18157.1 cation diffusion facilitator family transporter [Enterococcus canis]
MIRTLIQRLQQRYPEQEVFRTKIGISAGLIGLGTNLLLFIAKMFLGLITQSVSIMADAINNLSDTASSVMTLLGFHVSSKPADKEHPYGHERFEYISGLFIALLIIFVGFQFLKTSFERILDPVSTKISPIVFVILVLSILIKLWQSTVYTKMGTAIQSNTLAATAQDSRNDVLTTIVVLLSAGVELATGWRVDGYIGLLIALYILFSGVQMIKSFIDELLGTRPTDEEIQDMEDRLDRYTQIIGYHDLMVHAYGPTQRFATVHIEVDDQLTLEEAHAVSDRIERDFQEGLNVQLVCHLDPVDLHDHRRQLIRKQLKRFLRYLDDGLSLHDLRLFREAEGERLTFDVVVPKNCRFTDQELLDRIRRFLADEFDLTQVEVVFDHNYLLN